jgi:hypothetical protein
MKWIFALFALLLPAIIATSFAQNTSCPPPNIGFEQGSFANWVCDTGRIDKSGIIHLTPSNGPVAGRQTLIDKNYPYPTDIYGGFPTLCPNGSGHSIQLGSGALVCRLVPNITI